MTIHHSRRSQRGMFLIEALIAILIFSLGILGMMAMGGVAVGAQTDARFRTEASAMAEAVAGQIALQVNRTGANQAVVSTNIAASLANYAHQPLSSGDCVFTGAAAAASGIRDAVRKASLQSSPATGLPGADDTRQQIVIDPAEFNRVTITLCWKTPNDTAMRKHVLVTYVN